jgi:hypothetical protein
MDYRSMEGLKRALNRPKSALANSDAYSLVTNLNDDYLETILTFVNDKNPEWWNWSERTLEQEVKLLFNGIRNNEKDKGIQTTISSIGYALMCNNGTITEHEALIRIHDEWEAITSHYDSDERLAKEDRVSQYKNFEGLTGEEQNKDKVWITAVKEIVKSGDIDDACVKNDECKSKLCFNGYCAEPEALVEEGEYCYGDDECNSGSCVEDKCVAKVLGGGFLSKTKRKATIKRKATRRKATRRKATIKRKATRRKATRRKATRRMTKKRRVSKHKVTKRNSKRKNTKRRSR